MVGLDYFKGKCRILVYLLLLLFPNMLTTMTLVILYKTLKYCITYNLC